MLATMFSSQQFQSFGLPYLTGNMIKELYSNLQYCTQLGLKTSISVAMYSGDGLCMRFGRLPYFLCFPFIFSLIQIIMGKWAPLLQQVALCLDAL